MTIGEEEAQRQAVEGEPGEQTDESGAVRQRDAVGERDAASDLAKDMFVAPIGERSPQLQVGEGVGRRTGLMARGPANGEADRKRA